MPTIQSHSAKNGAGFNRGESRQDFQTPAPFMSAVIDRFGPYSFDLAAHEENKQHASYFSEADDSLMQEWHKIPGILWLNPPFSRIEPWAEKCAREADKGAQILFLTPASVGANWFKNFVHRQAYVLALNGRLSFDGIAPYPKDCILSSYNVPRGYVGFDVWSWERPWPK